ncbi:MAG TPA: pilus assembly PilX N-terminal domain-containing protein, partial [Candidatus Entotheonella sp.]
MKNERGSILIMTLLFVFGFTLLGISSIYFATIHNEQAERQVGSTKAFWLAEAGALTGLRQADALVNNFLHNTLALADPSGVIASINGAANGTDWLATATRDPANQQLFNYDVALETAQHSQTVCFDEDDQVIACGLDTNPLDGDFSYLITVSEPEGEGPAYLGSDTWNFPFEYEVVSVGSAVGVTRTVSLTGTFSVQVQNSNFARYAL